MTERGKTARDIAHIGIMSATLTAGKTALAFLPNIEIVSLLVIFYSIYFGRKTIAAVLVFTAVECMIWGINLWTVMYLYIWPLLAVVSGLFRKRDTAVFWAVFSGAFGLLFGGLGSLVYLFAGGPKTAFAWWVAGIPMDVIHCVSNFVIMLALYRPVKNVMDKIKKYEDKI